MEITIEEYIGRVIHYYSRRKIKLGVLTFNEKEGRFVINKQDGTRVKIHGLNNYICCGNIYIIKDNDKQWKIGQCEKTEDGSWKMLGTTITESNINNNLILYIPNSYLGRICSNWIDESFKTGSFSDKFIMDVLIGGMDIYY